MFGSFFRWVPEFILPVYFSVDETHSAQPRPSKDEFFRELGLIKVNYIYFKNRKTTYRYGNFYLRILNALNFLV